MTNIFEGKVQAGMLVSRTRQAAGAPVPTTM
jgi:hypothetical protein